MNLIDILLKKKRLITSFLIAYSKASTNINTSQCLLNYTNLSKPECLKLCKKSKTCHECNIKAIKKFGAINIYNRLSKEILNKGEE